MKFILLTFSLLLAFCANGQFQLNGVTVNLGGGVYQLTPAANSQFGAIWNKIQHDINLSFNVQGQMNFGADAGGADGMVFVMQNNCLQAGGGGGGLGYTGILGQSIGIEFDTYENIGAGSGVEANFDPTFDHIAVEKNGYVVHDGTANTITPPVQMDPILSNVKTGVWYNFQINYNATTKTLKVYFNGSLRVNIIYDIKANVFPGGQYVYWGFTCTTGGKSNIQQISINNTLSTHVIGDTTICTGSVPVILPSLTSLRGTNLALNNPVLASSSSNGGGNITEAVNGNIYDRWESIHDVDPQWIYVDLQSPSDLDSVVIYWEAARAKDYLIQTSTDAIAWTTQFSTTDAASCCSTPQTIPNAATTKDKIIFSATNVRYVRMYGTARLIGYGYSIWEFQVFGLPKYLWSTNNGTNATISPSIYSSSVTLSPAVTTTYSVSIPDPCVGYTTLSTTVTINCPTPVELIDFTAQVASQGTLLQWTSADEQNSSHFEILKSKDGITFYTIGTVTASGNNKTLMTYHFQDTEKTEGTVYYKLVSVDLDGSKQNGELKVVHNEMQKAIVLAPMFEEQTVLVVPKEMQYLYYSIYDMIGREISRKYIQAPSETIAIGQELSPACYLLKVSCNLYTETLKICKVK